MVSELLEIEETAETVDAAVEKALQQFDCSRAEVEIDIVQPPSTGLFGLFSKHATVRVRLNDRAHIATLVCRELMERTGFDAGTRVSHGSDQHEVEIVGEDASLVIGRKGQTLDALQYLTVALTDRLTEDRTAVVLDCDNYRQKRRSFIRRLGRRLSAQVKRSGKSITVQPLPPQERRIMHLTLQGEESVDLKSIGQGFERKMVISPRRG